MQGIPIEKKVFIRREFNGNVENSRSKFKNVHEKCDFRDRNDLILANTLKFRLSFNYV